MLHTPFLECLFVKFECRNATNASWWAFNNLVPINDWRCLVMPNIITFLTVLILALELGKLHTLYRELRVYILFSPLAFPHCSLKIISSFSLIFYLYCLWLLGVQKKQKTQLIKKFHCYIWLKVTYTTQKLIYSQPFGTATGHRDLLAIPAFEPVFSILCKGFVNNKMPNEQNIRDT